MTNLKKILKKQLHSPDYQSWTVKGDSDFSSFSESNALAGDAWRCTSDQQVVNDQVGGIEVYKGDLVIAMIDNPGELNYENLNNGNWDILRRNPIGLGAKQTSVDGGRLFEQSLSDDYLYLCVAAGTAETIPGAEDGTATWKKISLVTT